MRAESCCPSLEVMAISRDGRNVTSHSAASNEGQSLAVPK